MIFLSFLRVALVSAILFSTATASSDHKLCLFPKVRKEWRAISKVERLAWVKAVNCLAKLPHDPKIVPTVDRALSLISPPDPTCSGYDDWVYTHMDLNVNIHQTGYFLPWHRLYVQTFEDTLKSKCNYHGVHPYWDWRKDTDDFFDATIFSDGPDGLGAWGDPNNDYQITTGGFKNLKLTYPSAHGIRRNYTLQPFLSGANFPGAPPGVVDPNMMINTTFTAANVDYLMNSFTGNYTGFQAYLENLNGPHPGPHIILGGDMSGTCPSGAPASCIPGQRWSPNDPMFFLHHAMIDKIWYDWQHKDPKNKNAFGGGSISSQVDPTQAAEYPTGAPPFLNTSSVIPGDGLWGNVQVKDVMCTMGPKLCYIYA